MEKNESMTEEKFEKVYRPGILIASLGDSPVIISSMYDLLIERGLTIDRVAVLVPTGDEVECAYNLVIGALPDTIELEYVRLDFKDADSWRNACIFLQRLYTLLDKYEKVGDSVYLSLAGGRKSMAALMAWAAPLFPCVKKLYHVIDKEEKHSSSKHFRSAYNIMAQSPLIRSLLMHPKIDQLSLVTIPFEGGQQIGEELRSRLLSSLPDDYEDAEAFITTQTIVQPGDIPNLKVSKKVIAQFQDLCKQDEVKAQSVRNGLLEMSRLTKLRDYEIGDEAYLFKATKFPRVTLRYFTGLKGSTRAVFYTLPINSDDLIEQVVICSLEDVGVNGYKELKDVVASPDFSVKDLSSIDTLPPVPSPAESVLIVPLGKSPMVATQLYTLLTEQEKHTIHEMVLIYPEKSNEIRNGAELIQKLCKQRNVLCNLVPIPGLEDITDENACRKYQKFLEEEIDRVRQEYSSSCKIDLALCGGRKGMTAMTIFAAQKKQIPYVYHTLVIDEELSEKIEEETTFEILKKRISLQEAYDRLFLHAYRTEGQYPYARFVLFRVPILPLNADLEKVIPPEKFTVTPESKYESIALYYSYSDAKEDHKLLIQLQKQLIMLTRSKLLTPWHRGMIQAGENENAERIRHLNSVHIILLLVSPDFLEDERIYAEAKLAMQLRDIKGVVVIPINYRLTANWQMTVFSELQPLPKTGKALMEYFGTEREKHIRNIAENIRSIVESLKAKQNQ